MGIITYYNQTMNCPGLKDNVIYEFLGDFWHGNPKKFNHEKIHPHYKKSYGDVYAYTFYRLEKLKELGYVVKYIWESDWNNFLKNIDITPKILTY